jgi:hypothetical protein
MEVDYPIILFSQGKSMLSTDIRVAIHPRPGDTTVELPGFDTWAYFDAMRKSTVELPEDTRKLAESHFITARSQGREITAEELGLQLSLAKYIATTNGEPSVTSDHWERALQLCTDVRTRTTDAAQTN